MRIVPVTFARPAQRSSIENKLGLSLNFIFLQFSLIKKMSATSNDSDECSLSDDDSEFNFIPGRYWSIESENAMDASESGDGEDGQSESKDDGQTGIEPYSGEPMADEEWLKQYKLRQTKMKRLATGV